MMEMKFSPLILLGFSLLFGLQPASPIVGEVEPAPIRITQPKGCGHDVSSILPSSG